MFVLPATCPAEALLIGHRGASGTVPESTLTAFQTAFADGANVIECDVRTSADGVLVIMHDDTVDRTTNGTGLVSSLTLTQLKALDAGSWFSPAFAGEQVPTLLETLNLAAGQGKVLLDIKVATALQVKAVMDASSISEKDVIILTWSLQQLSEYGSVFQQATVLFTPWNQLANWDDATFLDIKNRGGSGYAFWYSTITAPFLAAAHAAGLEVFTFTVDSLSWGQQLVDMGLDGIITDFAGTFRTSIDWDPTLSVRSISPTTGGNILIQWRSLIGHDYELESSPEVFTGPWTPVPGTLMTASSALSESSQPATAARIFYRVARRN